jgi:rare lipoprotein A
MSSFCCDQAARVRTRQGGVGPDRRSGWPVGLTLACRIGAVVVIATSLSACAQSGGGADKFASLTGSRTAPVPAGRNASVAADRRDPVTASERAARTPDAAYGLASFYGHGSDTASGEKFNPNELTAAHRTLPFGTRVRVTNVSNGRTVTVRINDRGPFVAGRVVDVSYSAANALGMVGRGVAPVKLDVVQ